MRFVVVQRFAGPVEVDSDAIAGEKLDDVTCTPIGIPTVTHAGL